MAQQTECAAGECLGLQDWRLTLWCGHPGYSHNTLSLLKCCRLPSAFDWSVGVCPYSGSWALVTPLRVKLLRPWETYQQPGAHCPIRDKSDGAQQLESNRDSQEQGMVLLHADVCQE